MMKLPIFDDIRAHGVQVFMPSKSLKLSIDLKKSVKNKDQTQSTEEIMKY